MSLRAMLDHAAEQGYGVPAFNVSTWEQMQAVFRAAQVTQSPVLLQGSLGAQRYAGAACLRHMLRGIRLSWPAWPVCWHQDHAHTAEACFLGIKNGFSSVMMDGSLHEDGTPAAWAHNVSVTRRVVDVAHACGVSVEGELGCLGSLTTGLAASEDGSGAQGRLSRDHMLTDPEQARAFVEATGVDALAVAIGTSHGAYKFTRPPDASVLDVERVAAVHRCVPDTHLVLHGASSVSPDVLATINRHGGTLPPGFGVPVVAIQDAIRHGVRKINIDTDLRLAATAAVRQALAEDGKLYDPRVYGQAAIDAMQAVCEARFEAFGAAGQVLARTV